MRLGRCTLRLHHSKPTPASVLAHTHQVLHGRFNRGEAQQEGLLDHLAKVFSMTHDGASPHDGAQSPSDAEDAVAEEEGEVVDDGDDPSAQLDGDADEEEDSGGAAENAGDDAEEGDEEGADTSTDAETYVGGADSDGETTSAEETR